MRIIKNRFNQKKKVLLLVIVNIILLLFILYQIMLYDLQLLTESKLQLDSTGNGRIRGLRSIFVDFCSGQFDKFNEFLEKKIYNSIPINHPMLIEL